MTTAPSPSIAFIHNRMPLILHPADVDAWLWPHTSDDKLLALLRPYDGELAYHLADPRVGNIRNDSPDLIEPYQPKPPTVAGMKVGAFHKFLAKKAPKRENDLPAENTPEVKKKKTS